MYTYIIYTDIYIYVVDFIQVNIIVISSWKYISYIV